jgi:hypothetical protein
MGAVFPVIDVDSHKCENPVTFLDYTPARLDRASDSYATATGSSVFASSTATRAMDRSSSASTRFACCRFNLQKMP